MYQLIKIGQSVNASYDMPIGDLLAVQGQPDIWPALSLPAGRDFLAILFNHGLHHDAG